MKNSILLFIFSCSMSLLGQSICGQEPVYNGEGTYYDIMSFGGMGNCSFPNSDFSPFFIGAMNASQYGLSDYCGACAEVTGPNGKVKVHIIDQCPECKFGDIDLSPEAFDYLAPRIDGRIKISWKLVPCETVSPIKFYIKEGSSQYWIAVQVRNHTNKIEKLEYWNGSVYINLPRQDYNYFLASSGLGIGPYKFRITDVYGNQIIEENIPLTVKTVIEGKGQFPNCNITELQDERIFPYIITNNEINFGETCSFYIYDFSGNLIKSGNVVKSDETIELQNGSYIIKIIQANGVSKSFKVII